MHTMPRDVKMTSKPGLGGAPHLAGQLELLDGTQARDPNRARKFDLLGKLEDDRIAPYLRYIACGLCMPAPIAVDLDVSSVCNFNCPGCVDGISLNRGLIPADRLKALILELAESGVKAINFVGGGEPTTHSGLPECIQRADYCGLVTALVTNGSRLHKNLEVYAESVSSWLRVSVDAATARTHATVHGVDETYFPTIIDSLEILAGIKRAHLGYSFVVFPTGPRANYHEIADAARMAKDTGCDYFEPKVAVHPPTKQILPVPTRVIEVIREQVARARELDDAAFRTVAPPSLLRLATGQAQSQKKTYPVCLAQELRTTITPSGLYACTYRRGENRWCYGSLEEGSFQTLWRGPRRRQVKDQLFPERDCRHFCCRHQQNRYLHQLSAGTLVGADAAKLAAPPAVDDVWYP